MKLIHLSDLHIGKRVNEVSMLEDQTHILEQILSIIDDQQPQAVLIAGDIYDKSVPSSEAVGLLDDFLYALSKRETDVMVISGNHDSPERLAFGNRLMENAGIHVSGVYDGKVCPITLEDQHGPVDFWMLPFIKPVQVRRFFGDTVIESYTDACKAAVDAMAVDMSRRNVLITHQFVTGAATCESEELRVGGSDNVDAAVFDDFDYVALGHIHGPQNIGSNRIRYCGTPLKYSASEADHIKSVTLVELGEKGQLRVEALPLTPKRDLKKIRGTFDQLTDKNFYQNINTHDYLYITLTDEEDVPEAMGKLCLIYHHIMNLSYDNTRTRTDQIVGGAEDVKQKSPLELFEQLFQKQNNQPMTEEQRSWVAELMEEIWGDTQ